MDSAWVVGRLLNIGMTCEEDDRVEPTSSYLSFTIVQCKFVTKVILWCGRVMV
jgi:hypothetical protein